MDNVYYYVISGFILILFFLISNKRLTKDQLPMIKWALDTLVYSLNYWSGSKKYFMYMDPVYKFLETADKIDYDNVLSKTEKLILTKALLDVQSGTNIERNEKDVKFFLAGLTLMLNHEELKTGLLSLKDHKSIQVKKLTLLTIDTLGAIVELKNELDSEFFQHFVYGINKTLVQLRDGGYSEKSLEKAAATLFRAYQLTRAYLHLKGNSNLTLQEFHARFRDIFSRFLNILT